MMTRVREISKYGNMENVIDEVQLPNFMALGNSWNTRKKLKS